jgi:hypothetical protein
MTENEQIRQVLSEHPDLPVMLLTPNCGCDSDGYSTYYHVDIEASVESVLKPDEVQDAENYVGLSSEKWYTDEDDAVEDVSTWLFERWCDDAMLHGMDNPYFSKEAPDDMLTAFCGFEYRYERGRSMAIIAENLARQIVRDMPWHDYVVIEASL